MADKDPIVYVVGVSEPSKKKIVGASGKSKPRTMCAYDTDGRLVPGVMVEVSEFYTKDGNGWCVSSSVTAEKMRADTMRAHRQHSAIATTNKYDELISLVHGAMLHGKMSVKIEVLLGDAFEDVKTTFKETMIKAGCTVSDVIETRSSGLSAYSSVDVRYITVSWEKDQELPVETAPTADPIPAPVKSTPAASTEDIVATVREGRIIELADMRNKFRAFWNAHGIHSNDMVAAIDRAIIRRETTAMIKVEWHGTISNLHELALTAMELTGVADLVIVENAATSGHKIYTATWKTRKESTAPTAEPIPAPVAEPEPEPTPAPTEPVVAPTEPTTVSSKAFAAGECNHIPGKAEPFHCKCMYGVPLEKIVAAWLELRQSLSDNGFSHSDAVTARTMLKDTIEHMCPVIARGGRTVRFGSERFIGAAVGWMNPIVNKLLGVAVGFQWGGGVGPTTVTAHWWDLSELPTEPSPAPVEPTPAPTEPTPAPVEFVVAPKGDVLTFRARECIDVKPGTLAGFSDAWEEHMKQIVPKHLHFTSAALVMKDTVTRIIVCMNIAVERKKKAMVLKFDELISNTRLLDGCIPLIERFTKVTGLKFQVINGYRIDINVYWTGVKTDEPEPEPSVPVDAPVAAPVEPSPAPTEPVVAPTKPTIAPTEEDVLTFRAAEPIAFKSEIEQMFEREWNAFMVHVCRGRSIGYEMSGLKYVVYKIINRVNIAVAREKQAMVLLYDEFIDNTRLLVECIPLIERFTKTTGLWIKVTGLTTGITVRWTGVKTDEPEPSVPVDAPAAVPVEPTPAPVPAPIELTDDECIAAALGVLRLIRERVELLARQARSGYISGYGNKSSERTVTKGLMLLQDQLESKYQCTINAEVSDTADGLKFMAKMQFFPKQ